MKMQLQELKKSVDEYRQTMETVKFLLEKREREVEAYHSLKEQFEQDLIRMHRLRKNHPKKAEELEQVIADQSLKLSELKKELREIDHQLDELGEDHETKHFTLKKELISQLQRRSAEAEKEYRLIEKTLNEAKQREALLIAKKESLLPFFKAMNEGVNIPSKQGFFLRRNKKALLAQAIHHAHQEGKKIVRNIQDENFKVPLEEFLKEAEKSWNSQLYSGKFIEYYQTFSKYLSQLNQEIAKTSREIISTENAIDQWIEEKIKGEG